MNGIRIVRKFSGRKFRTPIVFYVWGSESESLTLSHTDLHPGLRWKTTHGSVKLRHQVLEVKLLSMKLLTKVPNNDKMKWYPKETEVLRRGQPSNKIHNLPATLCRTRTRNISTSGLDRRVETVNGLQTGTRLMTFYPFYRVLKVPNHTYHRVEDGGRGRRRIKRSYEGSKVWILYWIEEFLGTKKYGV